MSAREKIPFNDLLKDVEQVISKKFNTINEQQIDSEILAFISLYRHGAKQHSDYAKEWLTSFLINAGFVKNRRSIIYEC